MDNNSIIYYKVKNGDSLFKIAEQFGATTDELIQANPYLNQNYLQKDAIITIPQKHTEKTQEPKKQSEETVFAQLRRKRSRNGASVEAAVIQTDSPDEAIKNNSEHTPTQNLYDMIDSKKLKELLDNYYNDIKDLKLDKLISENDKRYEILIRSLITFETIDAIQEIYNKIFDLFEQYINYYYMGDFINMKQIEETVDNLIKELSIKYNSLGKIYKYNVLTDDIANRKKMLTDRIKNISPKIHDNSYDMLVNVQDLYDRYSYLFDQAK